tara:strand:- start:149 stop:1246 length:1098 start_codon:yes stop_codon:yes gene_type:complete
MANTLRIKRSTGSSAPTSLENAELAFAESTEVLYYGKGTGGAGGSATTINAIGGKGKFFDKDTSYTANYVLASPNGSSGAATYRALVAADLVRLDQITAPTAAVSANSQKITNLALCTNSTDAASKQYVDNNSQGLDVKDSVVVATTANGTLASAFANGQTVDGVSLSTNDRILLKDQSTGSENGIYTVNASGAPTRAVDYAAGDAVASAFCFVEKGTVNADSGWTCTNDKGSDVVGTNALTYAQFSGAGQITAGDGIQKSGNTLSADLKANGGLVIESAEIAVDLAASSITNTLPVTKLTSVTSTAAELNIVDGSTSATSTTLATADRLVVNDNGTMVQVALSDLVTFLENGAVSGFDIDGGTY